MRTKTLLAIAFASGLLSSELPASSDTKIGSTDSVVQQLANSPKLTPEMRAYCLLLFAAGCLNGSDRERMDPQYIAVAAGTTNAYSVFFRRSRSFEYNLLFYADNFALDHTTIPLLSDENLLVEESAINSALSQLNQVSDVLLRLNLIFMAERLFQKMENVDGAQKCSKLLEEAFNSCEVSPTVSEVQAKASVSVLNSMAYGIIPVQITDTLNEGAEPEQKPFTDEEFQASEKLKLRAAAIADRLPASAHVRRKVHRDLVLWYEKLGRHEKSANEMQVLYELVGTKDPGILYPHAEGCGQLVWWTKMNSGLFAFDCGMG